MPRHDGNTFKPRSRRRRVWLKKRGLIDLSHKEDGKGTIRAAHQQSRARDAKDFQ